VQPGEDDEEEDENDLDALLVVGGTVEYAIRKQTWVESVILALHDDGTVDIELKGTYGCVYMC